MFLSLLKSSLGWKLVIASGSIAAVMLALLLVNTARLLDRTIEEQGRMRINLLAPALHGSLAPALLRRDRTSADNLLQDLVRSAGGSLEYLVVLDARGLPFARAGSLEAEARAAEDPDAALADGVLRGAIALRIGADSVGELRYGLSLSNLSRARSSVLYQGTLVALIAIALMLIALALAGYLLTRPLRRLVDATRSISAGRYDAKVEIEASDEIGRLAQHFNEMIDAVQANVEAVREREERAQNLAALSSDWYWEQDENFRFREIDDPGAKPDHRAMHHIGRCRWELENTNLTPEQWAAHRKQLERHEPFHDFEYRRQGTDGKPHWVSVSGVPIFDSEGRFRGYCGVGKDITERKQAEATVARLARVLDETANEIYLFREDDLRFVSVNGGALRSLGYTMDEMLALTPLDIKPEFTAETFARLLAPLRSGRRANLSFETVHRRKNGSTYPVEVRLHLSRTEDPALYIAVILDITERRQAEQAVQRLNTELEQRVRERTAELEATNRELEAFTYSVSHDLKAPLRGIDGYSRLLLESHADRLDEEGQRYLGSVRQATAHMNELIDDLLAYSRVERRAPEVLEFDIRALVESLLLEYAEEAKSRGTDLVLDVRSGTARADREGLAMALRNLIDNALKFSRGSARPQVEIGGRRDATSCMLWVRDNGTGFDMKFHDRIFDIFQRLHRAEDYPGTGIGLAIVRKAMERMGGRAWAESAPGHGATFFLEIPQ